MNYEIRTMQPAEYPQLRNFLYLAIFIPQGYDPPPRTILDQPELQVYIKDFGGSPDDFAMAAFCGDTIAGAVWVRIMPDYGHVQDDMPSLAISVLPEYRRMGIGTALMREILKALQSRHYPGVSLSVQKENYAAKMYRSLGFRVLRETDEEWIMVYPFTE